MTIPVRWQREVYDRVSVCYARALVACPYYIPTITTATGIKKETDYYEECVDGGWLVKHRSPFRIHGR